MSAVGTPGDPIYDNTCPTPYYWPLQQNETRTVYGRIPSPTSPWAPYSNLFGELKSAAGCQTSYSVTGFQIGYATGASQVAVTLDFQDQASVCAGPANGHSISIAGLPGSASGAQAVWVVGIDLTGSPAAFSLNADGDGSFAGAESDNLFAWSARFTSPTGPVQNPHTGWLIAGAPYVCGWTQGTVWGDDPDGPGTGMSSLDLFRVDGPSQFGPPGCYSISGVWSNYLRIFALPPCAPPGVPFCAGDASAPCPCGNSGAGLRGCANSVVSNGGALLATGSTSPDSVLLTALKTPGTVVFLQGSIAITGTPFGDGVRCIGGVLLRLATRAPFLLFCQYPTVGAPSITARSAQLGDPIQAGSHRYYQAWYRDPAESFCPAPAGNLWNITNAIDVAW